MPRDFERESIYERHRSPPGMTHQDEPWLLGLYPHLTLDEDWYRKTNKHLVLACQRLPQKHKREDERRTILSMRKSVFCQLGLLNKDHPLHEVWYHQVDDLDEDPACYMSPAFFVGHARRLFRSETDIVAAFRTAPAMFNFPHNLSQDHNVWKDDSWILSLESGDARDIGAKASAEKLAEVLHIQQHLGYVATELPHVMFDNRRKQIAMARIALELYGAQDFSDPADIVRFLEWSPEALLLTALSSDNPTLENVQLLDNVEKRGRGWEKRKNFERHRKAQLLEALLVSDNRTVLSSKAINSYLQSSPLRVLDHGKFTERRAWVVLPRLTESHFGWVRELVDEDTELDEEWLGRMNHLIERGSLYKRAKGSSSYQYRRQFFEALDLYKGQSRLPAPHRLVELAENLEQHGLGNMTAAIVRYSLNCLTISTKTNEKILEIAKERGYDLTDPKTQLLIPHLLTRGYSAIKDHLVPFEEFHGGALLNLSEVQHRVEALDIAYLITTCIDTHFTPGQLVEILGLSQLPYAHTRQLMHRIEYYDDELTLGAVRKMLASLKKEN